MVKWRNTTNILYSLRWCYMRVSQITFNFFSEEALINIFFILSHNCKFQDYHLAHIPLLIYFVCVRTGTSGDQRRVLDSWNCRQKEL